MTIDEMHEWFDKEGTFDAQIAELTTVYDVATETQKKILLAVLVAVRRSFEMGPKYSNMFAATVSVVLQEMYDDLRRARAENKGAT